MQIDSDADVAFLKMEECLATPGVINVERSDVSRILNARSRKGLNAVCRTSEIEELFTHISPDIKDCADIFVAVICDGNDFNVVYSVADCVREFARCKNIAFYVGADESLKGELFISIAAA